jgi:hypothetical protein
LGGRFITNPLLAESSLSTCEDAQYANVPNDDRVGYPRMFLRYGDCSERALVILNSIRTIDILLQYIPIVFQQIVVENLPEIDESVPGLL